MSELVLAACRKTAARQRARNTSTKTTILNARPSFVPFNDQAFALRSRGCMVCRGVVRKTT